MSMSTENPTSAGDNGESGPDQRPAEPTVLPSAPVQPQSDAEAAYEIDYPSYRAVVTAQFPDHQSGMLAREQVMALAVDNLVVQWFDGQAQDTPESRRDESEDDTALLIHLDTEEDSEKVIRVCEQAGATSAKYYPARSITREDYDPDLTYLDPPTDD